MEKQLRGFVYVWRDRKHNRYYIGSHWGDPNDGYVCSSKWMCKAYKRRPQDFKRRIVAWVETNRADLLAEELRWLRMIKPSEIKIRYYNLMIKTKHWHADPKQLRSISQKLSDIITRKYEDPKFRAKHKAAMNRRVPSNTPEATAIKRAASMKAAWERKRDVGFRKQGFWWTDGIDTVMAVECPGATWRRGRTLSEEYKKIIRENNNRIFKGKTQSAEHRLKNSLGQKRRLEQRKQQL